jgi:DNA helicase II / ATP-dependent DNA helicase PcrA
LIAQWGDDDDFSLRQNELHSVIEQALGADEAALWQQFTDMLPQAIKLKELREVLWAQTDEQRVNALASIYDRLGQPVPAENILPPRVKVMTMHGAKGLAASVVFIPGLEDQLLPGPKRAPYPGLIWEAARLLYVSITRARAACIISYATRRFLNGKTQAHVSCRFNAHLGGAFNHRTQGLAASEIQQIAVECLTI